MYGPTLSSISKLISPWLSAYVKCTGLLAAFTSEGARPFVFHPRADSSRPHTAADWTRVVQRCFKRHSAQKIAVSPKNLRCSMPSPRRHPHPSSARAHTRLCSAVPHRSSFITFLKGQQDSELVDVPGVLKAAAVAMRHTEAMQGAAAYDKAKFDRAIAKAVTFCERYAQSFVARPTIVQSPAA